MRAALKRNVEIVGSRNVVGTSRGGQRGATAGDQLASVHLELLSRQGFRKRLNPCLTCVNILPSKGNFGVPQSSSNVSRKTRIVARCRCSTKRRAFAALAFAAAGFFAIANIAGT